MSNEILTGRDLLRFRLSRRWTQRKAALHLRVSQGVISKLEAGDKSITPLTRAKISAGIKRLEEVWKNSSIGNRMRSGF